MSRVREWSKQYVFKDRISYEMILTKYVDLLVLAKCEAHRFVVSDNGPIKDYYALLKTVIDLLRGIGEVRGVVEREYKALREKYRRVVREFNRHIWGLTRDAYLKIWCTDSYDRFHEESREAKAYLRDVVADYLLFCDELFDLILSVCDRFGLLIRERGPVEVGKVSVGEENT